MRQSTEKQQYNVRYCEKRSNYIKSIYRYLRKWNLPAGIKITIDNIYFDFGWKLITK